MEQSSLHVAIIMDGNGRWATDLGLPRAMGHRAGAEALRRVVEAAPDFGVGTLTAYAFSSDNWQRPAEEVEALMHLLAWYLEDETPKMVQDGVRLSVIGRRDRLPERLREAIRRGEAMTRGGTRIHLRLAID
jgi:undecaprenyl diphosphate synthase